MGREFTCEVRQTIGYNIDKAELIKALNYDRDQYNKGYQDGKADAQKIGRWIYKERNILINTSRVSYGENGAVQEKRWAKVKKPYCSECGWYEDSEYEATPYCPNCGNYNGGEENG